MKKLPLDLKFFLFTVYILTFLSLYFSIKSGFINVEFNNNYKEVVFFIIIIALTETFTVSFKSMSFSTSFAIHLAVYIIFGPFITILTIIAGFSLRILKVGKTYQHIFNTPIYGTMFNYCVLVLPIIYGNYIFLLLGGKSGTKSTIEKLMPVIIFCLIIFFVNTTMISILFAIKTKKNVIYCVFQNLKLCLLNILAMAPFGIIIAYIFNAYNYLGVLLVLFPIILSRYTFSLYIDSKNQYIHTVDILMRAVEARDKYTEGHSQRVSELSVKIAKALKYSDWKIEQLKIASLLHDVGKIGVSDQILNKPGKLTKEEFDIIKCHPDKGYNILKSIKNLESVIPIVRYHHERYDGKGYPDGKIAEELSLDVFIVQLADSIDAMATDRPYREALNREQIIEEVRINSGTQFHPKVVDAYFKVLEKEENVRS
jgi:putative nucleotidyltransferase with HDIG domain